MATDDVRRAELVALREDEARCIRVLAACRRFAVNVSGAAGNYATFAQNEELLLQSFHDIELAHASPDGHYDLLFTQRCQRAGLTNADVQMLQRRWQELDSDDDL